MIFAPLPHVQLLPFIGVATCFTIWAMLVSRPLPNGVGQNSDNYRLIEAVAKGLAAYMSDDSPDEDPTKMVASILRQARQDHRRRKQQVA
jgi:hypothetical protein